MINTPEKKQHTKNPHLQSLISGSTATAGVQLFSQTGQRQTQLSAEDAHGRCFAGAAGPVHEDEARPSAQAGFKLVQLALVQAELAALGGRIPLDPHQPPAGVVHVGRVGDKSIVGLQPKAGAGGWSA